MAIIGQKIRHIINIKYKLHIYNTQNRQLYPGHQTEEKREKAIMPTAITTIFRRTHTNIDDR